MWLGWNNKPAGKDTTKPRSPASYSVTISDSLRSAWNVGEGSSVVLSLAPTDGEAGPAQGRAGHDEEGRLVSAKGKAAAKPAGQKKPDAKKAAPDTTAGGSDGGAGGRVRRHGARAAQSVRQAAPPLEITVYRRKGRGQDGVSDAYELVLQTYVMPVQGIRAGRRRGSTRRGSKAFDWCSIARAVGQVVVDDIGFSAIDPAYLAERN